MAQTTSDIPGRVRLTGMDWILEEEDVRREVMARADSLGVRFTITGKGPNGYDECDVEGPTEAVREFIGRYGFDLSDELSVQSPAQPRPRLWYLDNEYSDYVIAAESADEAWARLTAATGIHRFGSDPDDPSVGAGNVAYHDLFELPDGTQVDNPHDLTFILT